VVHPPAGNREWITRLLDAGVWNLHIPQVATQKQVLDQYRRRLVEAARKHGKAVAMLTDSVEGVRQMIALGATIINYASDAGVLRSSYAAVVADVAKGA
jgi:2-keto-3-deoxy-L-rhamnonate aldolase RhmA